MKVLSARYNTGIVRRFVVLGHEAHTAPDYSLNDLPGTSGRIDVLVRCVTAAFLLSHGIRKDVELYLTLKGPPSPPRTIRFLGSEVRHLNPDERSTAALLLKALETQSIFESLSTKGIYSSGLGFQELLSQLKGPFVLLKEDGKDIRKHAMPKDAIFVISDHLDFTNDEENALMSYNPFVISLGPRSIHADQCIIIVNNELDRREAQL